ncbi:CENP-B N-terminal DNA-binding domain [Popillia japonica]|uniref:CENP-B N-terminal DNA-binding domain n=1 Tax=Popillia japonica TaxID=7064 RepID=A0AAW1HUG6_POPJA
MPNVSKGSKYKKKYTEKDVASTLNTIKNGVSKEQAAKLYGVPRATIQFRLSNKFTKASPGPSPILTASDEDTLVKWIMANFTVMFTFSASGKRLPPAILNSVPEEWGMGLSENGWMDEG